MKLKRKINIVFAVVTILVLVLGVIIIFSCAWTIPAVIKTYYDFEIPLPMMTVLAINVSYLLADFWYVVPGILVLIYLLYLLLYYKYSDIFNKEEGSWMGWVILLPMICLVGMFVFIVIALHLPLMA